MALITRFESESAIFDRSISAEPRSDSTASSTRCRRASRYGRTSSRTPSISGPSSTGSGSMIGARRSACRSLIIRSTVDARRRPATIIRSTQPSAGSLDSGLFPWVSFQSSAIPRTIVTGVFSSWLATSMKFAFKWLASSSRVFAALSSSIKRCFSTIRLRCSIACRITVPSSSGSHGLAM